MTRRALALALALLLLLTQQLGVQHRWSHDLGLPAAVLSALPAGPTDAASPGPGQPGGQRGDLPADSSTGAASDSLCQVCLVLAALAVAALPGLLVWAGQRLAALPVPARYQPPLGAHPWRPCQARAPPA